MAPDSRGHPGKGGAPKVSVLITSRNHEAYVTDAVASVLNQTFRDFELILIDDGSTDDSPDVIRRFMDQQHPDVPFRLLLRERRGRMPTLNEGLRLSTGTYFAPLVSDDTWAPDRLERQVPVLDEAGPGVSSCYADCWVIDEEGVTRDRLGAWEPFRGGDIYRDLVTLRYFPPAQTGLFRRSVMLEVGGFNERLVFVDDWDLWLKVARCHRVLYLPEPLGSYRIHGGNATKGAVDEFFADARTTFDDLIARDPDLPVSTRRVRANLDAWHAGHLYNLLMFPEARRAALVALRRIPSQRKAWTVLLRSMLGTRVVRWVRDRRREARFRGLRAAG
ncbi:MAG: glycosyltransferase [Actinomycetota bacterium]